MLKLKVAELVVGEVQEVDDKLIEFVVVFQFLLRLEEENRFDFVLPNVLSDRVDEDKAQEDDKSLAAILDGVLCLNQNHVGYYP